MSRKIVRDAIPRAFCRKSAQAIGKTDVSNRGLEIEWKERRKQRARWHRSAARKGLTVTVSPIHHVGTPCQEIFWFHFGKIGGSVAQRMARNRFGQRRTGHFSPSLLRSSGHSALRARQRQAFLALDAPLWQPMRILRKPPPQNPPIFQNRNIRILRIIANRNAHSPHLLPHRRRVPFSTRLHRKKSRIARPIPR